MRARDISAHRGAPREARMLETYGIAALPHKETMKICCGGGRYVITLRSGAKLLLKKYFFIHE